MRSAEKAISRARPGTELARNTPAIAPPTSLKTVGEDVGERVGVTVGTEVGAAVGVTVGAEVGAAVG